MECLRGRQCKRHSLSLEPSAPVFSRVAGSARQAGPQKGSLRGGCWLLAAAASDPLPQIPTKQGQKGSGQKQPRLPFYYSTQPAGPPLCPALSSLTAPVRSPPLHPTPRHPHPTGQANTLHISVQTVQEQHQERLLAALLAWLLTRRAPCRWLINREAGGRHGQLPAAVLAAAASLRSQLRRRRKARRWWLRGLEARHRHLRQGVPVTPSQ